MSPSSKPRQRMRAALVALAATSALVGLAPAPPAAAADCSVADVEIRFVCATYIAVAGRGASEADVDYWEPKVATNRTFFVATVARSAEGRRLVVDRYFSRFSEGAASEAEHLYWDPLVTEPNGLRKLEAALLANQPRTTDSFVTNAFSSQLGREPELSELDYWVDRADTTTRTQVAAEISRTLEARRTRVRGLYLNDLGHEPDEAGWAYWAERLRTGTSYLDVRIAIRASAGSFTDPQPCFGAAAPQYAFVCTV